MRIGELFVHLLSKSGNIVFTTTAHFVTRTSYRIFRTPALDYAIQTVTNRGTPPEQHKHGSPANKLLQSEVWNLIFFDMEYGTLVVQNYNAAPTAVYFCASVKSEDEEQE